jgi:YfiR/HmsC-like
VTRIRVTGRVLLLAIALVGGLCAPTGAEPHIDREKAARVKSAFVFNFLKFTRWPQRAFADKDSPFVIGVLGDDPLGAALDEAIDDKRIGDRAIRAQRFAMPDDAELSDDEKQKQVQSLAAQLSRCHLVYVTWSNDQTAARILARIDPNTTLIVADRPTLAHGGAMLALAVEDGRVVIYANRAAIELSELKVSSKLLQLARPMKKE